MPRCELCDREFKNGAGLAGHKQLKHGSEHSAQAVQEQEAEGSLWALFTGSERQEEGLGERLERHMKQVQEALERLVGSQEMVEQLVADGAQHTHGGEANCGECNQVLHRIGEKSWLEGFHQGSNELGSVPGVSAAQEFNKWAEEHMAEHPSSPVLASWEDVPGVKETIENYQRGQTIINITGVKDLPDLQRMIAEVVNNSQVQPALQGRGLRSS